MLAGRVAEARYLVADVAGDVASRATAVDVDPARLAAAQERLAVLTALVRRHGDDVDAVLAWAEQASLRLLDLDGTDDERAALTAQESELAALLGRGRAALTRPRALAAEHFGAAVSAELAELAMPHARVTAAVTSREDAGRPAGRASGCSRPDRTASTTWSCCWRRTRGAGPPAAPRAPPVASCPG